MKTSILYVLLIYIFFLIISSLRSDQQHTTDKVSDKRLSGWCCLVSEVSISLKRTLSADYFFRLPGEYPADIATLSRLRFSENSIKSYLILNGDLKPKFIKRLLLLNRYSSKEEDHILPDIWLLQ